MLLPVHLVVSLIICILEMGFGSKGFQIAHNKDFKRKNLKDKQNCPLKVHKIYYHLNVFLIYSLQYIYLMFFSLKKENKKSLTQLAFLGLISDKLHLYM